MAELHIKSLTCDKRQDSVGKDEASLQIGGFTVSGPHSMGRNDSVPLNVRRNFNAVVSVTLIEEDSGSAADNLGTVNISAALAGQGDQTGAFVAAPNAEYHMVFDVRP
jgi:hypothetical protein